MQKFNTDETINSSEIFKQLIKKYDQSIEDLFFPNIIEKKVIEDFIRLNGSEVIKRDIQFLSCTFNDTLFFENWIFEKSISFINCKFEKGLIFANSVFKGPINITGLELKGNLLFGGGEFQNVIFEVDYAQNIIIEKGTFNKLQIVQNHIKELKSIKLFSLKTSDLTGTFYFNELLVENFNLSGSNFNATIDIQNLKCELLGIGNWINHKSLNIIGLYPLNIIESGIQIRSSNLGNTQFQKIDFSKFSKFVIVNSYLLDANFINTKMDGVYFRSLELELKNTEDLKKYPINLEEINQLIEVYRQFKIVFQKQGNLQNENHFNRLELDNLYKTTSWKRFPYEPFWHKSILWASKYFTKYGSGFIRQLLWALTFNGIFLFLLILTNNWKGIEIVSIDNSSWDGFHHTIKEFLKLLSPIHEIDKNLNGLGIFIDMLQRIVSSFFIYGIIKATRRYLK